MYLTGKLSRWDDKRKFGFITLTEGNSEVFVHISAFPKGERRPQLNEELSFEIATATDGRKQAIRIKRQSSISKSVSSKDVLDYKRKKGNYPYLQWIIGVVVFVAFSSYIFTKYSINLPPVVTITSSSMESETIQETQAANASFECDGRIHCSQMTSCAEARYFLTYCPGTKMDGNNDGVPCEQQWCN